MTLRERPSLRWRLTLALGYEEGDTTYPNKEMMRRLEALVRAYAAEQLREVSEWAKDAAYQSPEETDEFLSGYSAAMDEASRKAAERADALEKGEK